MIITISGKPGSGKSTVAQLLAKKLNYAVFSTGDLRGQIAQQHGMTIDELNDIGKKEQWTDQECDDLVAQMGKTKDNLVFDSWLAWYFVPQAVKIFLDVDLKEAAKRIFTKQRPDEEHQDTVEGMLKMITKRMHETAARYEKWYGVDFLDMKNYDLVLDTTKSTPEHTVKQILEFVKRKS